MATAEHVDDDNHPNTANYDLGFQRATSILTALDTCKPYKRSQVLEHELTKLQENPDLYISVLDALDNAELWLAEGSESMPILRSEIANEGAAYKRSLPPDATPTTEMFSQTISALGGNRESIVRAFLHGFLDRPAFHFHNEVSMDKNSLVRASQRALDTLQAFCEAVMAADQPDITRRALLEWSDILDHPTLKVVTTFDLVMFWHLAGPPADQSRADIVVQTLGSLEFDHGINPEVPSDFLSITRTKLSALEKLWGSTLPDAPDSAFRKQLVGLSYAVARFLENPNEHSTMVLTSSPVSIDLGRQALIRTIRQYDKQFATAGCFWQVIPLPDGSLDFIIWNPRNVSERELRVMIVGLLERSVSAMYPENARLPMKTVDLIIAPLVPREADRDELAKTVTSLERRITGGLHGIGSRGFRTTFDLSEEAHIRELGFTDLTFRMTREGIRVELGWQKRTIRFTLDRGYKHHGLEDLSRDARLMLLSLVYPYLDAIKYPEGEVVTFLGQHRVTHEPVPVDIRRGIRQSPHLRLLPVGNQCQQMTDGIANDACQFQFGATIREINEAFLPIQGNRDLLVSYPSPMKDLLEELFRKIFARTEDMTRWEKKHLGEAGELTFLVVGNPPIDHIHMPNDPDAWRYTVYMVSFVDEAVRTNQETQDEEPVLIRCPGVGKRIIQRIGMYS